METQPRELEQWRGLFWVSVAYFAAFVTGVLTALLLPGADPFWTALRADVAATLAVFVFSFAFQNSSLYDPYWSVAPIFLVGAWILTAGDGGDPVRQAMLFAVVLAWGVRLTHNWRRGWTGLTHEDWRYTDIARKTGIFYWPVSLLGIHLFPTVQVFLGLWPAFEAVRAQEPWHVWEAIAPAMAIGAIALEAISDNQLRSFRQSHPSPDEVIDRGLWRWSRHPNYLGEIAFWWSLWLFAVLAVPTTALSVLGALAITAMFRFVSIPLMEGRMLQRRPAYQRTMETVPMLLPGPWR